MKLITEKTLITYYTFKARSFMLLKQPNLNPKPISLINTNK